MRGGKRNGDEVDEGRDAEGDLAKRGSSGPSGPALGGARERVGAETEDRTACDEVLEDEERSSSHGLGWVVSFRIGGSISLP